MLKIWKIFQRGDAKLCFAFAIPSIDDQSNLSLLQRINFWGYQIVGFKSKFLRVDVRRVRHDGGCCHRDQALQGFSKSLWWLTSLESVCFLQIFLSTKYFSHTLVSATLVDELYGSCRDNSGRKCFYFSPIALQKS